MNKLLLLIQTTEPDYLIKNFTWLMFTVVAILGMMALIRGIYKGATIKAIVTQILIWSIVLFATVFLTKSFI